jgi:hypothetical protein
VISKKSKDKKMKTKSLNQALYAFVLLCAISISTFAEDEIVAPQSIADPIEIVNGKPMEYTTNVDDNWFRFALFQDCNLLLNGESNYYSGSPIYNAYIYDEDMNQVWYGAVDEDTVSLAKGKYTMHINDEHGGKIMLYSPAMADDPTHQHIPPIGKDIEMDSKTVLTILHLAV